MAEHEQLSEPIPTSQLTEDLTLLQEQVITLQEQRKGLIAENIRLQDEMSVLRTFKVRATPRLKSLGEFLDALEKANIACALQTYHEGKWSLEEVTAVHNAIGELQMSNLFMENVSKLLDTVKSVESDSTAEQSEIGYEGER